MERQAADDDAGPRLGYLLKHAYLAYGEMSRTALEPHGVDGRDLAVLALIGGHDPMSQRDLATRLGVDRTTMVGLVDGLERRALVTRRPAPDDRRKNIVELTASGRRTLKSAGKAADAVERRFLDALSTDDARRFREALGALVRNHG